jgi:hypothetical protein
MIYDDEENLKVSDFSIFMPKSANAIFTDYPDLKSIPEFRNLSNMDMLFVWYFACEASPFYRVSSDARRTELAMEQSYLKYTKDEFDKKRIANLKAGQLGERIEEAVIRMRKFRIGPRVRAAMMVEKMLDNLEKIVSIDASDETKFANKDGELDFAKYKSYVDSAQKASQMLPELISQMEVGFNVVRKKKEGEESEGSFLDDYHEETD